MSEGVFVHPTSEVSSEARIGRGTKVWQHCTVLSGAEIGEGCLLSKNVYVEGRTHIGVELEDDVFVGPSAVFTNVTTPRSHWPRKDEFIRTLVKKGASIGANATVLCGVTIGRYGMIGAGSVVTRDVPDFALVYGTPAEQHGWVCHCGESIDPIQNENTCLCDLCGSTLELRADRLVEIQLCIEKCES